MAFTKTCLYCKKWFTTATRWELKLRKFCNGSCATSHRNTKDLTKSFWEKVQKKPGRGCWLWTASINEHGYGLATDPDTRRPRGAHIVAWKIYYKKKRLPRGKELDHTCRNKACVNPNHLEPVTHAANMQRYFGITLTHCGNGHRWTEQSTIWTKRGKYKICRLCRDAWNKSASGVASRIGIAARWWGKQSKEQIAERKATYNLNRRLKRSKARA